MIGQFRLTIELGNSAMLQPEDVAEVLKETAAALAAGATRGEIRDANGNTVGRWQLAAPAAERRESNYGTNSII